jgi:hypothetical protein
MTHLRQAWGSLVTAAEQCPSCGQTNPNAYVLGTEGCEDCGGTLPYKARPSKKHPGAIDVKTTQGWGAPSWVSRDPDEATRARSHGFVRRQDDHYQAGHYGERGSGSDLHIGEGRTAQAAVDNTFQNMADTYGAKWWKRK